MTDGWIDGRMTEGKIICPPPLHGVGIKTTTTKNKTTKSKKKKKKKKKKKVNTKSRNTFSQMNISQTSEELNISEYAAGEIPLFWEYLASFSKWAELKTKITLVEKSLLLWCTSPFSKGAILEGKNLVSK